MSYRVFVTRGSYRQIIGRVIEDTAIETNNGESHRVCIIDKPMELVLNAAREVKLVPLIYAAIGQYELPLFMNDVASYVNEDDIDPVLVEQYIRAACNYRP